MAKFLTTAAVALGVVLGSSLALAQAPEPTPAPNGTAASQPAAKKPRTKKTGKKKTARKKGKKTGTTTPPAQP